MTELDQRIAEALDSLAGENPSSNRQPPPDYIESFALSAREKAQQVLTLLEYYPPFETRQPFFISVGGGDGEEIVYLLENSPAKEGVLIEVVDEFALLAKARALPVGKSLTVLTKAAQVSIGEAIKLGVAACKRGEADAIVVSCHAVLHEMYDRGDAPFDEQAFFGAIFAPSDIRIFLTCREPGAPEKWPENVLVSADCSPDSLKRLADAIVQKHPAFQTMRPPIILGDAVRVHRDLGSELLYKLFYLNNLRHELEERVTALKHRTIRTTIFLATGEQALREKRAYATTFSGPTKSFINKWTELGVRVTGIHSDSTTEPLLIAESQTRVIAFRVPPLPPQPPAIGMPHDIAIAKDAFERDNKTLLGPILLAYGRSWIESYHRDDGLMLLKEVAGKYPRASLEAVWSRYLLSIAALFSGQPREPDLFASSEEVRPLGLSNLFEAEQMETLRKANEPNAAIQAANALVKKLEAETVPTADIERYALGTSYFLLANFLRGGGRYYDALELITEAERTFNPALDSHVTELAHCFYAKQVCIAMTGVMTFLPAYPLRNEISERFAGALIELSYAHAAWFLDNIAAAKEHAMVAASRFDGVGAPKYARRARNLSALLSAWESLAAKVEPNFQGLDETYIRGLRAILTGQDVEFLQSWMPSLRPSAAAGILQFAGGFSPCFEQPLELPLPAILLSDVRAAEWRWETPAPASSLKDADAILRNAINIPDARRIPLIAD